MVEYIEKEMAIERLEKLFQLQAATARSIIEAIPTADVQPVRHGRWLNCKPYNPEFNGYECSECGAKYQGFSPDNYCPNCGAKMDAEANE